jgi:hypothetical protein
MKKDLKFTLALMGTFFLMPIGILVGLSTRSHQISGTLMSNGKGGYMTFEDGYQLAIVFLAMAVAWGFFAVRAWRERKPKRQITSK